MFKALSENAIYKHMRFPTRTRFGWLIFLVLTVVLSYAEDVSFTTNGILGRILGLLALGSAVAFIIDGLDRLYAVDDDVKLEVPTTDRDPHHRNGSWAHKVKQWSIVSLSLVSGVIFIFLLGALL